MPLSNIAVICCVIAGWVGHLHHYDRLAHPWVVAAQRGVCDEPNFAALCNEQTVKLPRLVVAHGGAVQAEHEQER